MVGLVFLLFLFGSFCYHLYEKYWFLYYWRSVHIELKTNYGYKIQRDSESDDDFKKRIKKTYKVS